MVPGLVYKMQPGSSGDAYSISSVARHPGSRHRARANPPRTADPKKIPSSNAQDVVALCDTDDNACPRAVQVDENRHSLPLFYIPRRRAVSPYQPNSERADLRLQELIHHCMSILYNSRQGNLKRSRYYRSRNLDNDACGAKA